MTTHIFYLLDRTGSMANVKEATIAGFNAYLDGLAGEDIRLHIRQFDNVGTEILAAGAPPSEVKRLNAETYQPRSMTNLVDAAMTMLHDAERYLVGRVGEVVPRILVVLHTDGEENASRTYTKTQLKQKVEELQGKGVQFLFLGADMNAYHESAQYGISAHQTVSFGKAHTIPMYETLVSNTASYARGSSLNVNFTAGQKESVGDTSGSKI